MTTSTVEIPPVKPAMDSDHTERGTTRVFAAWCLRREACHWRPYLFLVLPVALAVLCMEELWWLSWHPRRGRDLTQRLLLFAAFAILAGGVRYAAQAVCWEVSREMRDLVRLTGLNPTRLLWCKTLSRWWTIGWSLLLLVPLILFTGTLGGATYNQLVTGSLGLALLAALTAGFAMVASVSSAEAENPAKTAITATTILLVLYNVAFLVLAAALALGGWLIFGQTPAWLSGFCEQIAFAAPSYSVYRGITSSALFSPHEPGYWLHFLTAGGCSWMASVVIENRFRNSPNLDVAHAPTESTTASAAPSTRPRCSDRPFFWKDVYILSDERGGFSVWTVFYVLAVFAVLLLNLVFTDPLAWVVVGAVTVGFVPVIVSLRFDALLAAEFRQQTWSSLMFLPIDHRVLLRSKLQAAAWEQRFVAIPVGIAVAFALPMSPTAILMTGVTASLVGLILCQSSALTHLLPKAWWVGPCQAIAFIVAIITCSGLWASTGVWLGFVLTAALLLFIVVLVQNWVDNLVQNWTDS